MNIVLYDIIDLLSYGGGSLGIIGSIYFIIIQFINKYNKTKGGLKNGNLR